jgi:DNA polymerase-1
VEKAETLLAALKSPKFDGALWGCAVQAINIDTTNQDPVVSTKIVCGSICGGLSIDAVSTKENIAWIDNCDKADKSVLNILKPWFEDKNVKKVWHDFGLNRRVMSNEGIAVQGFHSDTMFMARLWDSSRDETMGEGEGYL